MAFLRTICSASLESAIGASPSGKAAGFGPAIPRFESLRPSSVNENKPSGEMTEIETKLQTDSKLYGKD